MAPFLLIADSNNAVLNLLARFFNEQGYQVGIVSDGLACLEQMRRCWPEVLILDRSLLWGGAEGVLARMREDSEMPPVPVILTSTSAFWDGEFLAPPIVARLEKPFRLAALAEAVADAQIQCRVVCERD